MIIYEEVLKAFQKRKIKYILVGGMAFNLLGGYRNTLDMDIIAEMTDENLLKIVKTLKKLGYRVRQPVDPLKIADKKTRAAWIRDKHMKAFNFYKSDKSYEEVDIILDSPVDFKEASKDASRIKVGGLPLFVISKDNFIKMKKKAGRDKDLLDIKQIKMIGGLR
jgi:predicted nucleotidyltransferase